MFKRKKVEPEIEAVRCSLDDSLSRFNQSLRRLSQAAETKGRQKRENELAEQIQYFRANGAAE